METPYSTKDSREVLHDTSNATDAIKDWRTFWKDVLDEQGAHVYPENELNQAIQKQLTTAKQKAVDNFLEEICCALEELSGKEIFDCFVEAAQGQFDYTKKEHEKTSELLDLLTGLK
jgi:glutamyl-tRNA reductase